MYNNFLDESIFIKKPLPDVYWPGIPGYTVFALNHWCQAIKAPILMVKLI